MERNAETLMAVHTHTHTHRWNELTNRLELSSTVLVYDKIEKVDFRLSKHTKSM